MLGVLLRQLLLALAWLRELLRLPLLLRQLPRSGSVADVAVGLRYAVVDRALARLRGG
jgi:hypothetical protein